MLRERARTFACSPAHGVVVAACELIESNDDAIRAMVLTRAARWGTESEFADWIERHVTFCNTRVDRIVAAAPVGDEADALAVRTGYDDAPLTS